MLEYKGSFLLMYFDNAMYLHTMYDGIFWTIFDAFWHSDIIFEKWEPLCNKWVN